MEDFLETQQKKHEIAQRVCVLVPKGNDATTLHNRQLSRDGLCEELG